MGFGEPVDKNLLSYSHLTTVGNTVSKDDDSRQIRQVEQTDEAVTVWESFILLPQAFFAYTVKADKIVQFTNTSVYGASFVWDFGDGTTSTQRNPYHRFPSTGTFTVTLTARNSRGVSLPYNQTVVISQTQASASFTAVEGGLTVHFQNTSTATDGAVWDFGDGESGSGNSVSHTYAAAGSYYVNMACGVYSVYAYVNPYVPHAEEQAAFDAGAGSGGTGNGEFDWPLGIASDDNYLYVSDSENDRVQIFNKTTLAYVDQFGSLGSGDGQMNRPIGIRLDATRIYLVDANNNRIQIFNKTTHDFVGKFGSIGAGDGQFSTITAVDVDDSYIYVADNGNYRVQIFNRITYAFVGKFGSNGAGDGQFNKPYGIAVDDDYIYVSDTANDRIQIFNKSTYAFVDKFGTAGAGDGQMDFPMGLVVTDDYIYVADGLNSRIQLFNKTTYAFVAKFGSFGAGDGQLQYATDMTVDADFTYVSDQDNNRLQVFTQYEAEALAIDEPVAGFTPNVTYGTAPLTVNFTNHSTGTSLTYLWNFGDGTTSALENPTKEFTAAGDYIVTLTVSNSTGSDTTSRYIPVSAVEVTIAYPGIARISVVNPVELIATNVTFNATTSTTISSYAWNFGDGTTGSGSSVTHAYTDVGTYTVTLTTTDASGMTSTATTQVVITADADPTDNPPVAIISMSSATAVAPSTITFTGTTYDDVGAFFEWDFGDGSFTQGSSVNRTYAEPGTYIITCRAWGTYGETTTTAVLVIVGIIGLSSTSDNYYIIDKANHQLLIYNSAGTLTARVGGYGSGPGNLINPTRLCVCRPLIT